MGRRIRLIEAVPPELNFPGRAKVLEGWRKEYEERQQMENTGLLSGNDGEYRGTALLGRLAREGRVDYDDLLEALADLNVKRSLQAEYMALSRKEQRRRHVAEVRRRRKAKAPKKRKAR